MQDAFSFSHRLTSEVVRIRRSGGFLSLVVLRAGPAQQETDESAREFAERLRPRVRLHDSLGWLDSALGLLMPDTTMAEASRASARLLDIARGAPRARAQAVAAAGVATVYGEVEGGADALLAAAQEALAQAGPGEVKMSASLDGRPKVLVVDDDPLFARALAAMITHRGWDGHPCHDVVDARARARNGPYSALFVDLMLTPTVSGVDILREGIASQPRRPAILMSSRDTDHTSVLDALELGPVMFVRKPVSEADLDLALQMVRDLLPGLGRRRE